MEKDQFLDYDMEYNSQKEQLSMPEYGRHIQQMVNYARSVDDPELRQVLAEKIVGLMYQMNPGNKNTEDYHQKLWKHLFQIAEYDLEGVEAPNGEVYGPEDARKVPQKVPYPYTETRFRHYGHNVQVLIDKALGMTDGPKKQEFVRVIASYMKMAYRTWNQEHFVNDDMVKADLESLSGGKLHVDEDRSIDNPAYQSNRRRSNSNNNNNNSGRRRSNNRGRKGRRR